jgi:hypothetical protein
MAYSFHIPGRLPGMNEMVAAAKGYGGRGYGYSKLKKQWTNSIALIARSARIPHMDRVRLVFDWVEPTPSKTTKVRDPDNIAAAKKLVLDGLVMAGVLKRDTLSEVAGWTDTFAVGGAVGVRVTLEAT